MKDIVIEKTQALFDVGELKYQGEESEREDNPIYSPLVITELVKIYIIDEKKRFYH